MEAAADSARSVAVETAAVADTATRTAADTAAGKPIQRKIQTFPDVLPRCAAAERVGAFSCATRPARPEPARGTRRAAREAPDRQTFNRQIATFSTAAKLTHAR